MKIIATDNLSRETVADVLIAENVHEGFAEELVKAWNDRHCGDGGTGYFLEVVPDDRKLWRGWEELI